MADVRRPDLPDEDAGKSVDPERGARARHGSPLGESQSADPAEPVAPYTPGADQSAEQSCAVPAFAVARAHSAVPLQLDVVAELGLQHSALLALKHSPAEAVPQGLWVRASEEPLVSSPLELVAAQPELPVVQPADAVPRLWPE